jgi:hypothetical protein
MSTSSVSPALARIPTGSNPPLLMAVVAESPFWALRITADIPPAAEPGGIETYTIVAAVVAPETAAVAGPIGITGSDRIRLWIAFGRAAGGAVGDRPQPTQSETSAMIAIARFVCSRRMRTLSVRVIVHHSW